MSGCVSVYGGGGEGRQTVSMRKMGGGSNINVQDDTSQSLMDDSVWVCLCVYWEEGWRQTDRQTVSVRKIGGGGGGRGAILTCRMTPGQ